MEDAKQVSPMIKTEAVVLLKRTDKDSDLEHFVDLFSILKMTNIIPFNYGFPFLFKIILPKSSEKLRNRETEKITEKGKMYFCRTR